MQLHAVKINTKYYNNRAKSKPHFNWKSIHWKIKSKAMSLEVLWVGNATGHAELEGMVGWTRGHGTSFSCTQEQHRYPKSRRWGGQGQGGHQAQPSQGLWWDTGRDNAAFPSHTEKFSSFLKHEGEPAPRETWLLPSTHPNSPQRCFGTTEVS